MDQIFLLALLAALNPTLVAASTLMMILPSPRRLMLGYLLGALMTSITLGIIIVFTLEGSDTVKTTQSTLSPAATTALGVIALVSAFVIGSGRRDKRRARKKKKDAGPPRWQRAMSNGSARTTFVIGALLTLPGGSYLAGLTRIHRQNYPTAGTVALVIVFNLIMMALLEVPLISFTVAPHWTVRTIDRAKTWFGRHSRRVIVTSLTLLGSLLVIKGLIEFFS